MTKEERYDIIMKLSDEESDERKGNKKYFQKTLDKHRKMWYNSKALLRKAVAKVS